MRINAAYKMKIALHPVVLLGCAVLLWPGCAAIYQPIAFDYTPLNTTWNAIDDPQLHMATDYDVLDEPGMKRYWVPSEADSALFGTNLADHWFPVAQGGDIALLYGVLKRLLDTDKVNRDFIAQHTSGFDELAARARQLPWETLEAGSGLPRASIEEFGDLIGNARSSVFVWSMGITQHSFGGDAVQMILNVALARGFLGRD